MEIKPEELTVRDRYKLMIGSIVPRPIAFVSTISPEGALNLAPYSFFNGVGSNPMTVVFCPANDREGREKDTLRNCKGCDALQRRIRPANSCIREFKLEPRRCFANQERRHRVR